MKLHRIAQGLAVAYGASLGCQHLTVWALPKVPIVKGLFFLLALVALADRVRNGGRRPGVEAWAALAFAGLSSLSALWSVAPDASLVEGRFIAWQALLLLILSANRDPHPLARSLAWGMGAGAVVTALGFLQAWALGGSQDGRLEVFGGHPTFQARALAFPLLATASSAPALAVPAALLAFALGLTGSRSAWAAALAGAALRPRRWMALPVVAVALGALALGQREDLRPALEGVPEASVDKVSSGRTVIWRHGLSMLADHPLNGVGAGAFRYAYDDYQKAWMERGGRRTRPHRASHSLYVQVVAELGAIGAVALAAWLLPLARRAWSTPQTRSVLAFLLVEQAAMSGLRQWYFYGIISWLVLASSPGAAPPAPAPPGGDGSSRA